MKPFLLDTRAGEATSSCPGFLIEPRGTNERRDSLASEGWEGKGSWEEVEGKKQEILRAQNHFRASRDGSISGPLNLVLLNCHHFKNLLPAILRQNVSNILQKFSKIYHSGN